ncbi:hypothetical protein [Ralstonia sp. 24A2]|uniref:hypothetical protein n=1 Tax=Ralstonia sp. 24A2 TaxID=3447364 RepID=UPI003F6A4160
MPSEFLNLGTTKAYLAIAFAKPCGRQIQPVGLRRTLDRGRETLYIRCDLTDAVTAEAIGHARSVARAALVSGGGAPEKAQSLLN